MTSRNETILPSENTALDPPHSPEAEAAVLGTLLNDNSTWDSISGLLTTTDFYCPEHRLIFSAMDELIRGSKPADVITVLDHLERRGTAGAVGGAVYLRSLAQGRPDTGSHQRHIKIVHDCSIRRKLLDAGEAIIKAARNPNGKNVYKILDEAEYAIFNIGMEDARANPGFESSEVLVDQVNDLFQNLNSAHNRTADSVSGLRTGFPDIDRMIDGLRHGELIVIASPSLADASTLALNIVEHVTLREQHPVAVFSLRMSGTDVVRRMVCSLCRLSLHRLRTGGLSAEERFNLEVGRGKIKAAPLHIHSHLGLTALTLRDEARRLARQTTTLGLVVVDALERLQSAGEDGEAATASSDTCRALKMLAQELQCPVIVLTQIPQTRKSVKSGMPRLDDHPQAMALQEAADVVMLLHRTAFDGVARPHGSGFAEVTFSAPHYGFNGVVRLAFNEASLRFTNRADGDCRETSST